METLLQLKIEPSILVSYIKDIKMHLHEKRTGLSTCLINIENKYITTIRLDALREYPTR